MALRTLDKAFSAGELTPELFGRVDFAKFSEGLALCRNFIPLPHGPVDSRAGTEFVLEVKNSASATRLIPFSYNSQQTFAIEIGAGYFRFHSQAATLLYSAPAAYSNATAYAQGDLCALGGVNYYCITATTGNAPPNATYWYAMPAGLIYEIPNPYAAADVMDIHFVQSSDVLTLVHPNYAPRELRRIGATNWQLTTPAFNPPTNCPTAATATATGTGAVAYSYYVTSINPGNLQESTASVVATCTNDLTLAGHWNTVSWTPPAGTPPVRYNVYKVSNGISGYIGQAAGASTFTDNNITPDVSRTPPIYDAVFAATGDYPSAVSYFEQRRVFGGTSNAPQNMWFTRSGTESDMSYSIPVRDDNRIAFRIAAREASAIKHIVPAAEILLLTDSCEWRVSAVGSGALTPATINVKPQSYNGSNNVPPVVVNNRVLYAAARGGHIRELSYSWQANGYVAADISLLAPHLFDYNTITDMAYCRGPVPILWCVSSTGKLLSMTYVPEQNINAWAQHDTGNGDVFESICVIAENGEDMLYCVVRRTVGGATKRYVERLHTRNYSVLADAFFVDCGATYSGAPATTVSGLTWLEGRTVSILGDGAVYPQQIVTGGAVTVSQPCSKITVGLPIQADIQTMPVAAQIDPSMAQGRTKNVNKIWARLNMASGFKAGPSFSQLVPHAQRTNEPYGTPPRMVNTEIEVVLPPQIGMSGQVCIRQDDPLPLDVASITLELSVGGG